MIKKVFADTETTGLDPEKHEVHQIACIVTDENGKGLDYCNIKWTPDNLDTMTSEALIKTHLSREKLVARNKTAKQGFKEFFDFLCKHCDRFDTKDKMQFLAFNSTFDEGFIRALFKKHGEYYGSFFFNPSLCLQREMAWILQNNRDKVQRLSLAACCKYAQIEFNEDEAHDALYDIRKTLELYHKIK